jgi:hypothetical protein
MFPADIFLFDPQATIFQGQMTLFRLMFEGGTSPNPLKAFYSV